jgi:uncharacterized protein involved in copper resistance
MTSDRPVVKVLNAETWEPSDEEAVEWACLAWMNSDADRLTFMGGLGADGYNLVLAKHRTRASA